MHQKPDQMEETRWEGQNFSEVVVPQEDEEVRNKVKKFRFTKFLDFSIVTCLK